MQLVLPKQINRYLYGMIPYNAKKLCCDNDVNTLISGVKHNSYQKNRPFGLPLVCGCVRLAYMVSSLISAFVKEGISW